MSKYKRILIFGTKALVIGGVAFILLAVAGIYWRNHIAEGTAKFQPSRFFFLPPSDSSNISILSWEEAVGILHSGQVKKIMQTHALEITLILKNGKIINTKEPGIDDIFEEINKCGNSCKGISIATE
ncbi:MAG: hypothetical protein Q7K40_02620 [bacterium]|jgi:hypothetical protein|nr:hypothetical protein [bacterium]